MDGLGRLQTKKIPRSLIFLGILDASGWCWIVSWWSPGELNTRPQALCNQFYMRSRFIWI